MYYLISAFPSAHVSTVQDPLVAVSGRAIEAQGEFALSYILMLIFREGARGLGNMKSSF